MRFYSDPVAPGSKRSETPEGYLVIEDVPIARTGAQLYAPDEIGLTGRNGVVRVEREEEEVFRPETLASWNGKDVLNDHPSDGELVTVDSWRRQTCGTVLNPRRGEGADSDLTLADLVVKDPKTIRDIKNGKVEVSGGYDCEYEQLGPGRGRQKNIIGNHVAFVDKGRCGARCAVGDRLPPKFRARSSLMSYATYDRARPGRRVTIGDRWMRFADRFRKAVSTGDEEELGRLSEEAEHLAGEEAASSERVEPAAGGDTGELHVHVHTGDDEPPDPAGEPGTGIAPGGAEPDGDEPATRGDIARLMMLLKDIFEADDEADQLDEEEAEGGEVADRRMAARDRRRGARDRFMDAVGEIVELEHDPDSSGRNDAPGTAGSGAKGIKSELVNSGRAPGADRALRRRRSTGDRATADSAGLEPEWQRVVSQAEILAPGVELTEGGRPIVFDAAVTAEITDRRLCALRRRTLDRALATADGVALLDAVTEGQRVNLRTVGCAQLTPIFNAAAALAAERNRVAVRGPGTATADRAAQDREAANPFRAGASPAELNRGFRERYKR